VRAIWSGSISFGLVNIPVKLFRATATKTVRFHQQRVLDLIDRKSKGEEIVLAEEERAEVVDLMAMLECSVADANGRRPKTKRSA